MLEMQEAYTAQVAHITTHHMTEKLPHRDSNPGLRDSKSQTAGAFPLLLVSHQVQTLGLSQLSYTCRKDHHGDSCTVSC